MNMNKDRIEGKVKDVAGRVERQAGEWTDDPQKQVHGSAKQVEGKLQNELGKVKDASKKAAESIKISPKPPKRDSESVRAEESADEVSRSRR
jgi:uncharacterized protein YjbJ (UPF0337 family)